ncbi:MAG: alpha/beta fold hydrolase [Fidelibacterota bacterium]|nr:MAG: alpha/beta fold hydrolase [Candidatus Neomarinimicrobiota bacterium]
MQAEINDHALNYILKGADDGLPVVFIHGFPFSHRMWDPQLAALPIKYRAIAYDVRGHGQSGVGEGQYTLELFVDDLLGLLDYLDVSQAVVCGLSMGGYITLRAVERHPERFLAMILCDTRSEADTNEARIKRAATIQIVRSYGAPAFAEDFLKAVLAPHTFESQPDVVEMVRAMIISNTSLGICGTLLALAARTDTTPSLTSMDLPALVLVGEQDALTPIDAAQRLQDHLPQAQLSIIPDSAHLSNLENPAAFNMALLSFLDSLE